MASPSCHFSLVQFVFKGSSWSPPPCVVSPARRQRPGSHSSLRFTLFQTLFSLLTHSVPQASSTAPSDFVLRHWRSDYKRQLRIDTLYPRVATGLLAAGVPGATHVPLDVVRRGPGFSWLSFSFPAHNELWKKGPGDSQWFQPRLK